MNYLQLDMEEIDITDERFRISYFQSITSLAESISRMGVIQPVVVTERDGKYVIVCGWKRTLAGKDVGLKEIPALVWDENSDRKAYLTALDEYLSSKILSIVEKAESLKKLKTLGLDDATILNEFCNRLGIPANPVFMALYSRFSQMDKNLKRLIGENGFSLQVVQLLLELDPLPESDLMPYLILLGRNKQKQILEDLYEIGRRENNSSEQILKNREILHAAKNNSLSALQKAEGIRAALQKLRYPQYYKWKHSFESMVRRLRLPGDTNIDHSPFFEEDQIDVKIRFRNIEDYEKKIDFLSGLISNEEFKKLLEQFGHGQQ